MKSTRYQRSPIFLLSAAIAAGVTSSHAADLYWDANGSTAGFGTASGTWASPTSGFWSTDSTGSSVIGDVTTTSADSVFFGSDTAGLASGTVNVSGAQSAKELLFGKSSGDISLTGDQITLANNGSIWAATSGGSTTATHTINNDIHMAGGAFRFGRQNTANENYIMNGVLSGGFGIDGRVQNNSSYVALNGLNTFTGNVSIVTGQINANTLANTGVASSLGVGSRISMGGGGGQSPNLVYTGSTATATNREIVVSSNAAASIIAQNGALDLSGNIYTNTTNGILLLAGEADTGENTVSGVLADGAQSLKVNINNRAPVGGDTEDAYWVFSGANTYTGKTTLSAGTLVADSATALGNGGNVQFSGGSLKYTANSAGMDLGARIQNSGSAIKIDTNGQDVTYADAIANTNTGGLVKEGDGSLSLSITSDYGTDTTVNGGTLQFRNQADLNGLRSTNFYINDGSLEIQSSVGGNNRTVLNGKVFTFGSAGGANMNFNGGNHLFQGSATHNIVTTGGAKNTITSTNGGFMNMQGSGTIDFNVANGTDDVDLEVSATFSNGQVNKTGAGKLAFTGGHGGNYDITIGAGTVEVGGAARLNSGTYTANIVNSGSFSYNSTSDQTISGVISGTGAVVKDSTGKLTLTGANTYTGDTVINGGLLAVNGDHSLATGLVSVNDGGALGGVGTIGGDVIIGMGGQLDLTNLSVASAMTLEGNLDVSNVSAGSLKFELAALGASDMVVVENLIIDGLDFSDFSFTELNGGDVAVGQYTLIQSNGYTGSLGTNVTGALYGYEGEIAFDGNDMVLNVTVAVPEPSTSMLGLLGASALLMRRRR